MSGVLKEIKRRHSQTRIDRDDGDYVVPAKALKIAFEDTNWLINRVEALEKGVACQDLREMLDEWKKLEISVHAKLDIAIKALKEIAYNENSFPIKERHHISLQASEEAIRIIEEQ